MRTFQLLLGSLFVALGSLTAALAQCNSYIMQVPTSSFNDSGVIQPAASYNISINHCPPSKTVSGRNLTLQFLVHGGTSNKLFWSAFGPVGSLTEQFQPGNYSYVDFARNEGYHTVTIDRLGAGDSTRPDPTFVRVGLQVEQIQRIIQFVKTTSSPPSFPIFEKVILVGHSLGSLISNILLNKYPDAVDAVVLTAYSHVLSGASSALADMQFAPASTVRPGDFADLDPAYVTLSNETNRRVWYFAADGTFDPEASSLAFQRQDVQSIGEQASIVAALTGSFATETTSFSGPVAFLLGQNDQVFCRGDCGSGNTSFVELSKPFFPNVSVFTGYLLPNAGQFWEYHLNSLQGFSLVHNWLQAVGF